jgi:hypothetical protein
VLTAGWDCAVACGSAGFALIGGWVVFFLSEAGTGLAGFSVSEGTDFFLPPPDRAISPHYGENGVWVARNQQVSK